MRGCAGDGAGVAADAGRSSADADDAGYDPNDPSLDAALALDAGPSLPGPSRAGDLVITELMIDPKALSDTSGEWFELHNMREEALHLGGCLLDDGTSTPRAIEQGVVIAPGAYMTVARSDAPGFAADYVLPVSFTNSADVLAIECAGVTIDRIAYDKAQGYAVVAGASLALDPSRSDAQSNDDAASWCTSVLSVVSFGGDLGSPGVANPACAAQDAGVTGT